MRAVLALLLIVLPLSAAAAKKPTKPTAAQLEAQVKTLTEERDDLKQRLAGTEDLQQEVIAARKARDLARAEGETARREADQLKGSLRENQGGGDALLKELQEARRAVTDSRAKMEQMTAEGEELRRKTSTVPSEGDLVTLGEEVVPARPVNLNRVTPRLKSTGLLSGRPKGVVVVNVLINEKGDVVAARLLQGLPDSSPEAARANEACVDAAKRIVFDPAASKDGKTRFKVWQGVGFYLD